MRTLISCSPRHVQPGVNVRGAAEVPREGGTFELPDVPDAVVGDIAILLTLSNLESRGCAMEAISLWFWVPAFARFDARPDDWQPVEIERDEMDGTTISQNAAANRLLVQAQTNRASAPASTVCDPHRGEGHCPEPDGGAFLMAQPNPRGRNCDGQGRISFLSQVPRLREPNRRGNVRLERGRKGVGSR